MKPILEISHISKRFIIDHQRLPYYSFRDRIATLFKPDQQKEEFWALNDVSFSVNPGESIGIIGRNGAGKSTLLKILSRITPPSKGTIVSRGRIASLLEVGTGFHQELTGRENVFMNGSILGMKNSEIKARFDEIISFSGTEKFLDTPLKHYSSGMQLRLAFAVAAHLEPEVLIIDEVLAVGDAEFQRKCTEKMESIIEQGRTLIFVSHSLGLVEQVCKRGILLDKGRIVSDDEVSKTVLQYIGHKSQTEHPDLKIKLTTEHESGNWMAGSELAVDVSWPQADFKGDIVLESAIYNFHGTKIVAFTSDYLPADEQRRMNANRHMRLYFPNLSFTDPELQLDIAIRRKNESHYLILLENYATLNPVDQTDYQDKIKNAILSPRLRYES